MTLKSKTNNAPANPQQFFWLLAIAAMANLCLILSLAIGDTKTWQDIDWFDVAGEGGAALFVLAWYVFFLGSRPAGRVTTLLMSGLGLLFVALFQDALDEFIHFPYSAWWNTLLQSSLLPAGMCLLTWGIWLLQQEQKIINQQLSGRERLLRDHRLVDATTRVADARYLQQHLLLAAADLPRGGPFSLLLFDVNGFNAVNRRFGYQEGDRFLHGLAELLLLNLRPQDLLCRLAGDRFALLLGNCAEDEAASTAENICALVAHFCFSTLMGEAIRVSVIAGRATCRDADIEALLHRANQDLLRHKENYYQNICAA